MSQYYVILINIVLSSYDNSLALFSFKIVLFILRSLLFQIQCRVSLLIQKNLSEIVRKYYEQPNANKLDNPDKMDKFQKCTICENQIMKNEIIRTNRLQLMTLKQ